MTSTNTWTAHIYLGLRDPETHFRYPIHDARALCQRYVDDVGFCLTFTPTEFLYTGGSEPGVIIGTINYPRFPKSPALLRGIVRDLARRLGREFNQDRLSIVFEDKTEMVERGDV